MFTQHLRRLSALKVVVLALLASGTVHAQIDRVTGRAFATRSEVIAQNGMVCTSHPLATQIGLDILKAGGSAVDAAIAANAALGLMEPVNCGPGGDLFAIVYEAKTKKVHGLNASGRSPLGLSLEQLRTELTKIGATRIPTQGMLSISVPGAVDGWFELHSRLGKLAMRGAQPVAHERCLVQRHRAAAGSDTKRPGRHDYSLGLGSLF